MIPLYLDSLRKSLDFRGLATRLEYNAFFCVFTAWVFFFVFLEQSYHQLTDKDMPDWTIGLMQDFLAVHVPAMVAIIMRRLRDVGLSHYWFVAFLVPGAGVVMSILLALIHGVRDKFIPEVAPVQGHRFIGVGARVWRAVSGPKVTGSPEKAQSSL